MRRSLLLLLVVALVASSCSYREILTIRRDGSAEIRIEFDVRRADSPDGISPFLIPWEAAEGREVELLAATDDTVVRTFIVELFALEGTETWVDDAVEGFTFEVDEIGLRLGLDWEIDDLSAAPADDSIYPGSVILSDASVEERDDGTMSLVAPARDTAADFLTEYFALDADPFTDRDALGPDEFATTVGVELDVPGTIERTDAHERSGSTLQWTWELGRDGPPGVDVAWDPDGEDGRWDVCGAFAPVCFTILILLGLLVIGGLVAILALSEAWRVTRRDRRDIAAQDESP